MIHCGSFIHTKFPKFAYNFMNKGIPECLDEMITGYIYALIKPTHMVANKIVIFNIPQGIHYSQTLIIRKI